MNEPYKVSICVPIYGVEKYIERCAKSLFEQTYENIEYIFVNDCTKDCSIEILLKTLEKYPKRETQVQILQHEYNRGLAAARNSAIEKSTGRFIMHVDSDDWIHKDCIRLCVKKQVETNSDIVSVDIMRIGFKRKKRVHFPQFNTPKEFTVALLNSNIAHNVVGRLILRSLYFDNGIRAFEGINMSEDFNMIPRLTYFAEQIASIPEILYYYDLRNEGSYTANFSENNFYQVQKALDVLKDFFSDKDSDYLNALENSRFRSFWGYLIKSGRANGHRKFYEKLRVQLELFPRGNEKSLSLPERIAFHIRWYPLFSLYVKIAAYVKRLYFKY